MPEFEVFFNEKVRSKLIIKAESLEEAKEIFNNGDYSGNDAQELDAWDAEIEEINELS